MFDTAIYGLIVVGGWIHVNTSEETMLLIALCAVVGLGVAAAISKPLGTGVVGGLVIGIVALGIFAAQAKAPKVGCWGEVKKWKVFTSMPQPICQARVKTR